MIGWDSGGLGWYDSGMSRGWVKWNCGRVGVVIGCDGGGLR